MKKLFAALLLFALPAFGQLDKAKDFAVALVSTTYDAAATSITLSTGQGAKFLDPATSGPFYLVWWNYTDYPSATGPPTADPNLEVVRVTARSGDVLTVTRGQAGTSAAVHNTAGKDYYMMNAYVAEVHNSMVDTLRGLVDRQIHIPAGSTNTFVGLNGARDSLIIVFFNAEFSFSAANRELSLANGIAATRIGDGTVSTAEFQYINTLSSNAQTQLDAKQAKAGFPVVLGFALSDETTALTASTSVPKLTFRIPFAMTVTAVRASVGTAPTGATILVDIHETGTTILSTKVMIDASEFTSTTATTAYVISDASLADDAEITLFCDQIGSTIAGAGLKIWIIGTRTAP